MKNLSFQKSFKILVAKNGFTLVELIIALGISTIAILGAMALYVNTVRENQNVLESIKLNHNLRNSMNIMASHIRRAGYWTQAETQIFNASIENPFMTVSSTAANNTIITIYSGASATSSGNCILFAYNVSLSSTLPSIGSNPDDRFGFRLNNGVIQYRVPSNQFTCSANASSWANMTDENKITVDNLSFTEQNNQIDLGGGDFYTTKSIIIEITAHLTNNPNVSTTVTHRANVKSGVFSN